MSKFVQYLIIFGIAMVPIVELRGALPVAYGFFYDAAHPFTSVIWSYLIIAIGNMVPVPFIFFFARRFLEWGKDKKVIGGFCRWCLKKGEKGGQKLQAKAGRGLYVALMEERPCRHRWHCVGQRHHRCAVYFRIWRLVWNSIKTI